MSEFTDIRRDYKYLLTIGNRHDIVEVMGEVEDLMADPTKRRAHGMYVSAMEAWMYRHYISHPEYYDGALIPELTDSRALEIANDYYYDQRRT